MFPKLVFLGLGGRRGWNRRMGQEVGQGRLPRPRHAGTPGPLLSLGNSGSPGGALEGQDRMGCSVLTAGFLMQEGSGVLASALYLPVRALRDPRQATPPEKGGTWAGFLRPRGGRCQVTGWFPESNWRQEEEGGAR